jgi:hypothetical protein
MQAHGNKIESRCIGSEVLWSEDEFLFGCTRKALADSLEISSEARRLVPCHLAVVQKFVMCGSNIVDASPQGTCHF